MPVSDADRQANALQQGQIDDVVAHIAHLLVAQFGRAQNLLVRAQLFQRVQLHKVDTQFFGSIGDERRGPAGNDSSPQARLVREADAQSVARMETFGLNQPALRAGDSLRQIVDGAVGQYAVHVHQEELDLAGALLYLAR